MGTDWSWRPRLCDSGDESLGINRIATHDQAFREIGWVEVIDDIPTANEVKG
jgi:hypothetical protein